MLGSTKRAVVSLASKRGLAVSVSDFLKESFLCVFSERFFNRLLRSVFPNPFWYAAPLLSIEDNWWHPELV